jgi:crotonobetainyl-CoA:carnitine CoA-transferase CaiB-like acyl-CoA transferase
VSAYAGVRILDFSQGVAGPMAAMLLGDFAAEVVKVEPPEGDRWKERPGYLAFNRNKQVLTLDLATPEDLAEARRLIAGTDIAIFDAAPGRLEALGLDAATLTAAHPALIHAWMPPYGTTGRWSGLPAHHDLLLGLTGIGFKQGAYADQPIHLNLPVLFYAQGVMGAAAMGAALFERTRSGRGQGIVVSGLNGAAEASGTSRALNIAPLPRGVPPGANPRYRLYQCADGEWFFLGTLFTNFYRKAFEALGLGDVFEVMELDMTAARDLLIEIFATRPRDEWLELLQANDVPCGPVGSREAWFAGEVIGEAGLRLTLQDPEKGEVAMPAPPARFSATPAKVKALPQPIASPPAWAPRAVGPAKAQPEQPLSGVRVLNLGTVIAGAYAGTILANLGAEVWKIESRDADPFRSDGHQFLHYNRGVRGLGLDLKRPEARALFLELAAKADVVIDNYRLGVRARLGIDYPALKAVNPRLISVSVNAYGDTGPRAARPGFDPLLQAEGGMMAGQGGKDDPILYTIAVNDIATAGIVAASVIAALNARERTGEGQEILTSLAAQSLLFQIGEVTTYPGRPPNDLGGLDCIGVSALHRFYACADGWIGLVCERPKDVAALAGVLGLDLGDPAAALAAPRDGEFAKALEAAFAVRPREPTLDALLTAGVAAAPAIRGAEALESEYLKENRYLEPWTHPRLGPVIGVRGFSDFSRTPTGFRYPTPDLGQHTRELLAEFGLPATRIEALFEAGAVFEPQESAALVGAG